MVVAILKQNNNYINSSKMTSIEQWRSNKKKQTNVELLYAKNIHFFILYICDFEHTKKFNGRIAQNRTAGRTDGRKEEMFHTYKTETESQKNTKAYGAKRTKLTKKIQ